MGMGMGMGIGMGSMGMGMGMGMDTGYEHGNKYKRGSPGSQNARSIQSTPARQPEAIDHSTRMSRAPHG